MMCARRIDLKNWMAFLSALILAETACAEGGLTAEAESARRPLARQVQLNKLALSAEIKDMLRQGVSMPLVARSALHASDEGVVSATLTVRLQADGLMRLEKINPLLANNKSVLSPSAVRALKEATGRAFGPDGALSLDATERLQLDMMAMRVDLFLDPDGFAADSAHLRESTLQAPSSGGLSSVLKYAFNGYSSRNQGRGHSSGYLTFDNTTSLGVDHVNVMGSAYLDDAAADQSVTLDRIMYERDIDGKRLALGMVDGWNLQSLGNVSTLNGSRMYGFSYGNVSQTLKLDASQSLNPIDVYLPATGEVRVKREGRLLSTQRLGMGNHRLDTSALQAGVYDVEVEVLVAGQVQSRRVYRINKPVGGSSLRDGLNWQLWGGAGEAMSRYGDQGAADEGGAYRPLFGLSVGALWHEVDWNLTLYQNDKTTVEEGFASWQLSDAVRASLQNLLASDGTRRRVGTLNLALPHGVGSVWLTGERGAKGRRLNFYARDYDSLGANFNLRGWNVDAGSLNLSYDRDRGSGYQYMRADYSRQVYNGKWGGAQLQLGTSRNLNGKAADQQYYAMLTFNLAIDGNVSVGMSHRDGGDTLDLSASKSFENSVIDDAGVNASISREGAGGQSSSYGAYVGFNGRYGQGNVSADVDQDSRSASVNLQGGLAWGGGVLAVGGGQEEAGIVVDVPETPDGALEAVLNEQAYSLRQGRNLIAVPAYNTYHFYVRDAESGKASYEVSDTDREYTLYPGNVVRVTPKVKPMVTVFGQLTRADGAPLRHVMVRNHIGQAQTDEQGNFAIDVDQRYPEVSVEPEAEERLRVNLDLKDVGATAWLGKIVYGRDAGRVYAPLRDEEG